jgi:molecular chaperone DnaJ
VPRSAKDGQTLRVRSKGRWGLKGRGDIRLELQVEPHPKLKRSVDDLYVDLPVGVLQAVLGGEAVVSGLDEDPYRIAITPGSSSGKRFRLAGKGMYKSAKGDERGDLFAQISVQVPSKLTPRQERLWEMLLEAEMDPDSDPGSDLAE